VNLVLIGYRGTGKSAVGRQVASALGMRVVSLDEEIVAKAGKPIPDIVAQQGWVAFRDLEQSVCQRFGADDGLVIDCGGGVVEREANMTSLRQNGKVIWLRATPSTIVRRIGGDTQRPSLTGDKSFTEEVEEVLSRREPLYERMAHASLDTDDLSIEELVGAVQRLYRAP